MKIRYIIINTVLLILFLQFSLRANTGKDTIPKDQDDTYEVINMLDSMLNTWYVQQSINNEDDMATEFNDSLYLELPDSMYINRIKELDSYIPLSYNSRVRSFIRVYTVKRRRQVEMMLGMSEYYFPIFEQILDANDLPLELKYLPIIESALNTHAVSRAGATGIWQFMYPTAKMYGLYVDTYVDERRDPMSASHAAARYLKDLYNIYNDWILAIAAYNCGPGNVNKAIRRCGGKTDFWEIYPRLPRETRGYVPAFIAACYVMSYPDEHKLKPRKYNFPRITDTITLTEKVHFKQVAEILDIPLKQIRDLNPQYRRDIIPATEKKPMGIRLTLEKTGQFIELQDSILNYKDSVFFHPDSIIVPPPATSAGKYIPPPPDGKGKVIYTVKSGDNLGYIASWFHVNIRDIRYWNDINRNFIRSGDKLVIYIPENKVDKYNKIDGMTFEQKQKMIGKTVEKTTITKTSDPDKPYTGGYIYYKVKDGDTLWEIAKKFDGVTDSDIIRWNNIENARNVKPGQVLKIRKVK